MLPLTRAALFVCLFPKIKIVLKRPCTSLGARRVVLGGSPKYLTGKEPKGKLKMLEISSWRLELMPGVKRLLLLTLT